MDQGGRSDATIPQLASQSSPGQGGDVAHAPHPLPLTKVCEVCGCTFGRKKDKPRVQWLAQRFCGRDCMLAWRSSPAASEQLSQSQKRRFASVQPPVPDRFCAVCETPLVQHKGEKLHIFRKRRTCSRKCGHVITTEVHRAKGIATRAALPVKTCERCQKQFFIRDTEAPRDFVRRKFCSRQCSCKVNPPPSRAGARSRPVSAKRQAVIDQLKTRMWPGGVAPAPKYPGADSVEAFLARGGQITRCPVAYLQPIVSGSPAYGQGKKGGAL